DHRLPVRADDERQRGLADVGDVDLADRDPVGPSGGLGVQQGGALGGPKGDGLDLLRRRHGGSFALGWPPLYPRNLGKGRRSTGKGVAFPRHLLTPLLTALSSRASPPF